MEHNTVRGYKIDIIFSNLPLCMLPYLQETVQAK